MNDSIMRRNSRLENLPRIMQKVPVQSNRKCSPTTHFYRKINYGFHEDGANSSMGRLTKGGSSILGTFGSVTE
jgi:hypothetical protein